MYELQEHKHFFSNTKLRYIKSKYHVNKRNQSDHNLQRKAEGETDKLKSKFLSLNSNFKTTSNVDLKKQGSKDFRSSEESVVYFNSVPNLETRDGEYDGGFVTNTTTDEGFIKTKLVRRREEVLLTKEEAQVLNLNKWQENQGKMHLENQDTDCLANKYSEIDIIYKQKKLQDDLAKMNLQFLSKTLARFYRRSEEEKATIFIQNINLSKENFKFDIFIDNLMSDDDFDNIAKKNFIHIGSKVGFRDKREIMKTEEHTNVNDDYFTKYYNLKIEGEMSKLTSIEFYRNIIKERERVENIYRKE
jgi:hypothetical protein